MKRQGEQAEWGWLIVVPRDELRMREGRGTLPPEIQLKGVCAEREQKLLPVNEAAHILAPHFALVKWSFLDFCVPGFM